MITRRKIFNIYEMIAFMLISTVVSSLVVGYIMFKQYDAKKIEKDYTSLVDNPHISEFINNYGQLMDKYYKDIDEEKLIDSAIKGMLDYLGEPYTEYMEENQSNNFNEQLKGSYKGIGVEISQNAETKEVFVNKVFANSPAEKAGVLKGDIFFKINGLDITGKDPADISNQIKYGEEDTSIIVFLRDGKEVEISITRDSVELISAEGRIINHNGKDVGYLKISSFAAKTSNQVKEIIKNYKEKKLEEVIIDLRGNTGGYLETAMSISEQFLEKGKIILYLETKEKKSAITDSTEDKVNFKIVLLVDSGSASASEILAGALKYSYGIELVGTKTYGKGKFQETGSLSSGATIKYTAGVWNMPNDQNIDGIGILPDHEVELSQEYIENPIEENDNQLKKALEVVTSK